MTDNERRRLLVERNDTAQPVPTAVWAELFEAQVARAPDAVAVVFDRQGAFLRAIERAGEPSGAAVDRAGRGSGAVRRRWRCRVGPDMVVALVAVWKAGAGYLPIDPAYPVGADRVHVHRRPPGVVLVTSETVAPAACAAGVVRLVLDDAATVEKLTALRGWRRDRRRPDEAAVASPIPHM